MTTPGLVFSTAAMADIVGRFKQTSEQTCWCWAAALTDLVPVTLLQKIIVPATESASCSTVYDAEYLADAGFRRILLTSRVVDAELLRRLMNVAVRTKLVAVIDHFRHAELLSQSALQMGSAVEILIEVKVGENATGVCPGSDASLLATAAARLPGLRVSGVFASDVRNDQYTEPADLSAALTSIVTIAEHCLRSVHHVDPECREIVLATTMVWNSSFADRRVTCLIASPFVASPDEACAVTDEHGYEQPSVCLVATVISRPSLESCVIDAGRITFGEASVLRIAAPLGASVVNENFDSTVLSLRGESQDLRIGDTVRLVMSHPERLLIQRRIFACEEQESIDPFDSS